MDASRQSLCHILSVANSKQTLLGDPSTTDKLYFTLSLHELLALHVKAQSFHQYMGHWDEHTRRSNSNSLGMYQDIRLDDLRELHQGASVLHVLLYRNSYHMADIAQVLLDRCPRLASIPMNGKTYPIHILTAHSLTLNSKVLDLLLQVGPETANLQDDSGDTPLSLLFKNVIRFRWAREANFSSQNIARPTNWEYMTIIYPEQFLDYSLRIVKTIIVGELTWHEILRIDRLPPLLVQMLLAQHFQLTDFVTPDRHGKLPLHYCAQAQAMTLAHIPNCRKSGVPTVLSLAVQQNKDAVHTLDRSGRYPLDYAVANTSIVCQCHMLDDDRCPLSGILDLVGNTTPLHCRLDGKMHPVVRFATRIGTSDHDDDDDQGSEVCELGVLAELLAMNPTVCIIGGD